MNYRLTDDEVTRCSNCAHCVIKRANWEIECTKHPELEPELRGVCDDWTLMGDAMKLMAMAPLGFGIGWFACEIISRM